MQLLGGISSLMNLPLLIGSISRSIVLPLSYQYVKSIVNASRIEKIILFISTFVVISTVPFHLDLITPLSRGYDLSIYGTNEEGFVGIFQRAHPASASLAVAVIILVNAFLQSPRGLNKYIYGFWALIGSYSAVLTYARSGLAMMIVGLFVLVFSSFSFRNAFRLSIISFFFASVLLSSNSVLKMRLLDKNIYATESAELTMENVGSGRLMIAEYAIANWWNEGYYAIWMGLGEPLARERMIQTKGSAIFAHNGVIEVLQTQGLVGLVLMFWFYYAIYKLIRLNSHSSKYTLNMALFSAYIVGFITQGNDVFIVYILMALGLCLFDSENKSMSYVLST